jgi:hypothetical protein
MYSTVIYIYYFISFIRFRYDEKSLDSARSNKSNQTARSIDPAATGRTVDTFRSTMSTSRVHTALAALTAEKQALMAKLNAIDAALEGEEKKKVSKPRGNNRK